MCFLNLVEEPILRLLYEDANHIFWVGTMGKGIFLFDPANGKFRAVNENKLLRSGSILSISGRANRVYVSSLEGCSLFETQPANKDINENLNSKDFTDIKGVGSNIIYSIYEDKSGRIWFATDGRGIVMYSYGGFTSYDESSGLKDKFIYSITEDHKRNIWFSTRDAGIYQFDGKKFRNYAVNSGLSAVNISAIKTDREGNIVVIHKNGIDILDPETGLFTYFNSSHGIKEVNVRDLGTVAQDMSGNIFFSTTSGIVRYHPLLNNIHKPYIFLEKVELFQKDIPTDQQSFSHDENNFTFNFTGIYYTDPEALEYQYMLEGYSNQWMLTKDRSINFPKLSPGKYKFRVRASINRNFEGADEAQFEFRITKPFWTTAWFIILVVTTIGSIIFLYIRSREKNLRNFEKVQQDKIKFQFETLRNQVNPHFLFNSFNTLISTIEDDPKAAVEYVEQLSEFFRNIVTYRDKDIINLNEELLLLNTYFFIQQKRFGTNLALSIEISEEEKENIFIPPLTLQLLAENAIKHNSVSKETPLMIRVRAEGQRIHVQNNLNPKFSNPPGAGMGLQNIINRYHILTEADVVIKKEAGYFSVLLPVLKMI